MRRLVSTISLCLVLILALTPPTEGVSGHCDQHHGQVEMAGHDMAGHTAPDQSPSDDCDHCPPAECASAAPCAGSVHAVILRASASPPETILRTEPSGAPHPFTTRAPEPTYPPPRLA
jgi:hypothetical protein